MHNLMISFHKSVYYIPCHATSCNKHTTPNPLALKPPLGISLIRHPRLQIIILTQRVLQTILTLLHMPLLIPSQPRHSKINQALRTITGMIARQFPPHRTAETGVLDIFDFLARDLRVVV
jgi:hypothetical protein